MTNEEAIQRLAKLRDSFLGVYANYEADVMDYAISALERDMVRERVSVGNVMEYRHVKYDPDEFFSAERKMTNADRIRSYSDEELARWLINIALQCVAVGGTRDYLTSKTCWLDWLKQEVEE